MNVLVIGKGGREHAICKALLRDPAVETIFVAPGNPGMKADATLVPIEEREHEKLVAFAKENEVDLTIVGPEAPLVEGIANTFQQASLAVFGPSQAAAQLEGSKAFAKEFMRRHEIPTATYAVFHNDPEAAKAYVAKMGAPIVVKADGLAAGKGVVVAFSVKEAFGAIDATSKQLGEAGSTIVLEEYLQGEECSFMAFVYGETVVPLALAQDYKRAFDGGRGPNTGGMGAISPVPHLTSIEEEAIHTILQPTASGLVVDGTPFCGILYAGLMVTEDGPKVIEFNVRFGDPETEVVLPRLESPLAQIIVDLLQEKPVHLTWSEETVCGVVVAAEGYPHQPRTGKALPNISIEDICFAGVSEHQGSFLSAGGRVCIVTAKKPSLTEARRAVYERLNAHHWEGFFYRNDIARTRPIALT